MLNREQLMHFAEHGWVLEENIFTQGQVEQIKRGLDRLAEGMKPHHTDTDPGLVHAVPSTSARVIRP